MRIGGVSKMFTPQPERDAARRFCTTLNDVKRETGGVRLAVITIDKILLKIYKVNEKLRNALLEELQICHPELLKKTKFAKQHAELIRELA